MPPRPKRDRISEIFKKPTSFKIKNQQVSVSEYKAEISQLISIMPELEKALPSSGKVIVGESVFPGASQGTQLVYALQNIKKIDPKVFELIRDKKIKDELDNIYIDENGNIHHSEPGSTTPTTPSTPTTPTTDPNVEERKNQGMQFAKQLIKLPWTSFTMPMTSLTIFTVILDNGRTVQLKTVLNNPDMKTGFFEGLCVNSTDPSYDSSNRWRKVFSVLGITKVISTLNDAITFGSFTGLIVQDVFGVPYVQKKTDNVKVISCMELMSQNLYNGPKPTDGEKEVTAGDAVNAFLNAHWDHGWFLTTVTMSHEQAQSFGKGCKFLGPWLIEQGRKLQQSSASSESDSDSDTAKQIVGTILVVLGNVIQYVGQAILDCDKGKGIVLYTNFWAGFILTGVPVVWPESR